MNKTGEVKPKFVLEFFNTLAKRRLFPCQCNKASLILLQKIYKPLSSFMAFRSICLLDIEGKLFEQLILIGLKEKPGRTGGLVKTLFKYVEGSRHSSSDLGSK